MPCASGRSSRVRRPSDRRPRRSRGHGRGDRSLSQRGRQDEARRLPLPPLRGGPPRRGRPSARARGSVLVARPKRQPTPPRRSRKRHKQWGAFWAERGYVALLVDSFGPRGFPEGFGRGSYAERPAEVSEQTVRPLDAYGGLRYLRARKDVDPARVGVQGWSNGGMTVLVTMSEKAPGIEKPTPETGFRAGLALYPGCGMDAVKGEYRPYAPLTLLIAGSDEEVSPADLREVREEGERERRGGPLRTSIRAPSTTSTIRARRSSPSRPTSAPPRTRCAAPRSSSASTSRRDRRRLSRSASRSARGGRRRTTGASPGGPSTPGASK